MMNKTSELKRVIILSVLAFVAMLTYAIARPATESLFLEAYTKQGLPLVWLLVALGMVGYVWLYNRVVQRFELMHLYGVSSIGTALLFLLFLWGERQGVFGMRHALYILKDIYIVVLVEIFYSYCNAVFPIKRARWYYGLFSGIAGVGSILGNLFVGELSKEYGTLNALSVLPPLLLVLGLGSIYFSRLAGAKRVAIDPLRSSTISEALQVTRRSSYLILILFLIALTQISITLIDYQYNGALQTAFPDTDLRTAVIGRIYAAIDAGSLVFQIFAGPVLRLISVPAALLAIPVILGTSVGLYLFIPIFLTMAIAKVASKVFDYSLFKIAKELLYIPLSYIEKTSGKSLVDMMMYRVAKGLASLLLIGLAAVEAGRMVGGVTVLLIGAWIAITILIIRRFRLKVSREKEIKSEEIGY